ncbi:hypothetical protein BM47_3986 [Burkholderia mallei]|nr:hypothetical protein BM47_3986 [Burkholderia mallei]
MRHAGESRGRGGGEPGTRDVSFGGGQWLVVSGLRFAVCGSRWTWRRATSMRRFRSSRGRRAASGKQRADTPACCDGRKRVPRRAARATSLLAHGQPRNRRAAALSSLMCRCADVPMCRCADVPMCRCADVPMCRCADVPMCRCADVPMCRCADVPMCRCADVPMCRCADVPMCRCADVPMCRCADVPMCRCADVPMCRCADVPMCRCADVPMCRCADARSARGKPPAASLVRPPHFRTAWPRKRAVRPARRLPRAGTGNRRVAPARAPACTRLRRRSRSTA